MLAPTVLPNSAVATRVASTKWVLSRPASATIARLSRSVGSEKSALRVKSPGRNSAVLITISVLPVLDRGQHLLVAGDHDVAAEHEIGAAGRDADGVDVLRPLGDAHVAVDRAALLREPRHVDDADALAFEMRRHAEDAADGDDAGAADAGDDDVVGLSDRRQLRLRQRRPAPATAANARLPLLELARRAR